MDPTISRAALIPGIQSRLRDWAFLDPSCGTKPPVNEGSGKREAHGELDLILVSSSYSEDRMRLTWRTVVTVRVSVIPDTLPIPLTYIIHFLSCQLPQFKAKMQSE